MPFIPRPFGMIFFGIIIAVLAVLWDHHYKPLHCSSQAASPMMTSNCKVQLGGTAHFRDPSWKTWFGSIVQQPSFSQQLPERAGTVTAAWDPLYHLGGNGPWIEKTVHTVPGGIAVPDNCEVEQVHMLARHAERYPTKRVAKGIKDLISKMKDSRLVFRGDLEFFDNWSLFWTDNYQIDQLISTGPYAGTLGAFTTGVRLRTQYQDLLSSAVRSDSPISFWASGSRRVIDTAKYFGIGFFGADWQQTANLVVIPEAVARGANTLTPGRTCLAYLTDKSSGHDQGYNKTGAYRETYVGAIRDRLKQQNPGIVFTNNEIYTMQEIAGFEILARGSSPWIDVFTPAEFESFEYARDILHYYRSGPGTKYAAVMGSLWLNATSNLLVKGTDAGRLFLSFVHDGDIAPMLTALGIVTDEEHLPVTHIKTDRKWRKSQISPMGGRTIFELLRCTDAPNAQPSARFVRVLINDGATIIPGCDSGPGYSCPSEAFAQRIAKTVEEVGDFQDECGLAGDAPTHITFLHQ